MSSDFINGSKYAFSTTLGVAHAISAITNANPPAFTSTAMPSNDDIVLLQSGWSDLSDTAFMTDSGGTLFEQDTTDTKQYPPGEGVGSWQLMDGFVTLDQIREAPNSGGDTNFFNWSYVEDSSTRQRTRPTDKNPINITFTLDRDSTKPWFAALRVLDKSRQLSVLRETLKSGEVLLYTGYWSFQPMPTRTRNENMTVTATFSVNSDLVALPATFPSGS